MFIVYGVSPKNKVLGYSMYPRLYNACGAQMNWNFLRRKSYFTLFFFLKLFPVGKADYFYCCPNCKYGFDINSGNLYSILNELQMNPQLNNEINGDRFRKYLAKIDSKMNNMNNQQIAYNQMNNNQMMNNQNNYMNNNGMNQNNYYQNNNGNNGMQ